MATTRRPRRARPLWPIGIDQRRHRDGHEQIGCRAEAEHGSASEREAGHAGISLIELVNTASRLRSSRGTTKSDLCRVRAEARVKHSKARYFAGAVHVLVARDLENSMVSYSPSELVSTIGWGLNSRLGNG